MTCIGVLNETHGCERRVAIVPDGVTRLRRMGLDVAVQSGAGVAAHYPDAAYAAAGARLVDSLEAVYDTSDVTVRVSRPALAEANLIKPHGVLFGLLQPWTSADLFEALAGRGITSFALERMPRIARAQSMDVLSSQSTVSGYKAAVLAATSVGKVFPMLMTAAGTIAPTRVLVLGAGVAGLQAIATARRLGALVYGYDIRPAAKEQVESLGATFISPQLAQNPETQGGYATAIDEHAQEQERDALLNAVRQADAVIATALVPGKRAPTLLTQAMVASMADGSVIVDIAAEAGGNCELTVPGQPVTRNGVTIVGAVNLPSTVPVQASQLFSRNITNFLEHIAHDGTLSLDMNDPVVGECCVTHDGQVRHGLGLASEAVRA